MVFRMRTKDGGSLWAGGALRGADGRVRSFKPGEVQFATLARWRSPRTGNRVSGLGAGASRRADPGDRAAHGDQELDARSSTGTIYWEGAVRAKQGKTMVGRGYLELNRILEPLRL